MLIKCPHCGGGATNRYETRLPWEMDDNWTCINCGRTWTWNQLTQADKTGMIKESKVMMRG